MTAVEIGTETATAVERPIGAAAETAVDPVSQPTVVTRQAARERRERKHQQRRVVRRVFRPLVGSGWNTPRRLIVFAAGVVAAFLMLGGAWSSVVDPRIQANRELRDRTVPLVATAEWLTSSVSEADSALTAAFLSGTAGREELQRYLDAIDRSASLASEAARLAGNDTELRSAVAEINEQIGRFSGLGRAATARQAAGDPKSIDALGEASSYLRRRLSPSVNAFAIAARQRLALDRSDALSAGGLVPVASVVVVLILLAVSAYVARVSRRILNPGLVAAGLIVVATTIGAMFTFSAQERDLNRARDQGTEPSERLSAARTAADDVQYARNTSAIAGSLPDESTGVLSKVIDREILPNDELLVRRGESRMGGLLGTALDGLDGAETRAVASETVRRWSRYVVLVSATSRLADTDQFTERVRSNAVQETVAFAGFTVTADSLLDLHAARAQTETSSALDRLESYRQFMVAAPLIAMVLGLWGLQRRIGEYR